MDIYWDSISTAINLIVSFDKKLIEVFFLSFKVTIIALFISSGSGPEFPMHVVQPYPTVLKPSLSR